MINRVASLRIDHHHVVCGDQVSIDHLSRELARLEAFDQAAAQTATSISHLGQIEASLRETYHRPRVEHLGSFGEADLDTYQRTAAKLSAKSWGDDLSHKEGQRS